MRVFLLAALLVARPALLSAKQPPPIVDFPAPNEGRTPSPSQPSSKPTSAEDAAPLVAGEPAPFDGVLLTEEKIMHYLRLDIDLVAAKLDSEAKDKAINTLQLKLEEKFAAQERQGWLESVDGRVGIVVGAAAGVVAGFWLGQKLGN